MYLLGSHICQIEVVVPNEQLDVVEDIGGEWFGIKYVGRVINIERLKSGDVLNGHVERGVVFVWMWA